MALLYERAGRLTAENGGFRPGQKHKSAVALLQAVGAEELKIELSRLGLKCGGTPAMRADRLWLTKDTPLRNMDPKLFAKGKGRK